MAAKDSVFTRQEAQQWTLDRLWKASWWQRYVWSRDPAKHRAEQDVEYFTVLALKRSSFSNVGAFALKEFPNTVMGTSSRHAHSLTHTTL